MASLLKDERIQENLRLCSEEYRRVRQLFDRGTLTPRERRDMCARIFRERFYEFIHTSGLEYRVTAENAGRFQREYLTREITDGPEWLFSIGADSKRTEAEPEDHRAFLAVADAFLLPAEYFLPFPEGVVKPLFRARVYGTTSYPSTIDLTGGSDGGMASDPAPEGKSCILTDRYGLKAELTVDSSTDSPVRSIHGCGAMEGYTSRREREMTVFFNKGTVMLHTVLNLDDMQASRDFPLWQDYYLWLDNYQAMMDEVLEKQYLHFSELTENG